MERGKKLLGKQSHVSESETNNLSAGELWFCLFVSKKLKVSSFKFNFYVPFYKEAKQWGEQGKMVVKRQG